MVSKIELNSLATNDIVELLKHVTTIININSNVIEAQTAELRRIQGELSDTKEVVESWLKLGSEHNELQTVFWDDDIVNLLKYMRGEEIE